MADKLADSQIESLLTTVPTWTRVGDSISCKFTLKSFPAALMFAATVGHLAEAADHHPDILIQWKHVTLTLSTHSAGGLTEKDFSLARQVDELPQKA